MIRFVVNEVPYPSDVRQRVLLGGTSGALALADADVQIDRLPSAI